MREIRHPAEKVLRNEHGYLTPDKELMRKFDQAGIPAMNLVSAYGCVFGMLTYYLDELSGDIIYRWYEPGEKVPSITLPDMEEMEPYIAQFKQAGKPAAKTNGKAAVPIYDDEDDEL